MPVFFYSFGRSKVFFLVCQTLPSLVFPFGMSHFGVPCACGISLTRFSGILSHSVIFCLSLWMFVNNIKHLLDFNHSLSTETGSGLVFYMYHCA